MRRSARSASHAASHAINFQSTDHTIVWTHKNTITGVTNDNVTRMTELERSNTNSNTWTGKQIINHEHVEWIKIQKSTICEGYGLFAMKQFKKGHVICDYVFDDSTGDETIGNQIGKRSTSNLILHEGAHYVNSSNYPGNTFEANAALMYIGQREYNIQALKQINDGDEIFIDYGQDYWNESFREVDKKRKRKPSQHRIYSSGKF